MPSLHGYAPHFRKRLSDEIRKAKERCGSYQGLEKEVRMALGLAAPPISRKQLAKIGEGQLDVSLRFDQLDSLDRYLRLKCESSLSWLFGPISVPHEIASHGEVTLVLGSQPDSKENRIDLSRWDVMAMRELLDSFFAVGLPLQVNLEDVIFRENSAEVFTGKVPGNERWYDKVNPEELRAPSVAVLGSPKANHCAEVVVARLLGVEPFKRRQIMDQPFAFVWPKGDERSDRITSCVRLDVEQDIDSLKKLRNWSPDLEQKLVRAQGRPAAMVLGDRVHEVIREGNKWKTYAVLCARRIRRRIFLCVMGLTGPATLGASKLVRSLAANLNPVNAAGESRTAWAAVEVEVTDSHDAARQDMRCAESQKFITDICYL